MSGSRYAAPMAPIRSDYLTVKLLSVIRPPPISRLIQLIGKDVHRRAAVEANPETGASAYSLIRLFAYSLIR
jgi:hypothetical protein